MKTVSLEEFKAVLDKGLSEKEKIIDVRYPSEFKSEHIEGAENIPYKSLSDQKEAINKLDKAYFYCQAGIRCKQACEDLEKMGLDPEKLVYVKGHLNDWEKAGIPFIKGKATFSIQRQVYLLAGSLILIGMIFGLVWNPWWFLLPFFIGFGFTFSAIRGVCYTEMLLEKMPWN